MLERERKKERAVFVEGGKKRALSGLREIMKSSPGGGERRDISREGEKRRHLGATRDHAEGQLEKEKRKKGPFVPPLKGGEGGGETSPIPAMRNNHLRSQLRKKERKRRSARLRGKKEKTQAVRGRGKKKGSTLKSPEEEKLDDLLRRRDVEKGPKEKGTNILREKRQGRAFMAALKKHWGEGPREKRGSDREQRKKV